MNALTGERLRQEIRWGEQNHPDGTGGRAFEHWEASMKRQNQAAVEDGTLTWSLILREEVAEALNSRDVENLKIELVQVAAVCQAWFEAIERRQKNEKH